MTARFGPPEPSEPDCLPQTSFLQRMGVRWFTVYAYIFLYYLLLQMLLKVIFLPIGNLFGRVAGSWLDGKPFLCFTDSAFQSLSSRVAAGIGLG